MKILQGEFVEGDTVVVDYRDGEYTFTTRIEAQVMEPELAMA
jgi:hypothetical protein